MLAWSVAQRTREIGIRMALGAQRGDVLKMVLRQGGTLTLVGVALGLVGAYALTKYLAERIAHAVRRAAGRPSDLRGDGGFVDAGGAGCLLRAGAPRGEGGPDGRAQVRVSWANYEWRKC